jgi:heme-degrading monooxygenase HmoA
MFAVIFEVQPRRERFDEYLDLARALRPSIERIDGFVDNERFESRTFQGRILSLSIWRDEKSLVRWRTLAAHHEAQKKGRFEIFEDYHLRVGEVVADTGSPDGASRGQCCDGTETGAAKIVTVSEAAVDGEIALPVPERGLAGMIERDEFLSLTGHGKRLLLLSWRDRASADAFLAAGARAAPWRHRTVWIIRDYGMADRREAPQYLPPATPRP